MFVTIPPREVILSAPRRSREDDADGDTEQPRQRLLQPLALNEADRAGKKRNAQRRDQRGDERTRGHVHDNEHEAGCGCFDDAARASERVGPREVIGGCLTHPAWVGISPPPRSRGTAG